MCNLLKNSSSFRVLKENRTLTFCMFLLTYVSCDTLLFGTSNIEVFGLFYKMLYMVWMCICFLGILNRYKLLYIYLLVIPLLIVMSSLITHCFVGGVILQIAGFIIAYFLIQKYSLDSFLKNFEASFFLLTALNLIFYVAYLVVPSLFSIFPTVYNSLGYEYKFFVVGQFLSDYSGFVRNAGIFREPGVHTIYLLMGLIINLFFLTEKKRSHVILFLLAIFTTLSSAGFVLALSVLALYYISKGSKGTAILLAVSIVTLIFILPAISGSEIYLRTFGKLNQDSELYGSTEARVASIVVPMQMIRSNPIFGVGQNGFTEGFARFSNLLFNVSIETGGMSTNTFLNIGATYGVPVMFMLLFAFYRSCKSIMRDKQGLFPFLLFLILVAAFSNEDLRYSVFYLTLILYGAKKDYLYM